MSILYKLKRTYRKYRFNRYRKLDKRILAKHKRVLLDKRALMPQSMPDDLNEISGIQEVKFKDEDSFEKTFQSEKIKMSRIGY